MDEQSSRTHSADAAAASTRADRRLEEILAILRSRPPPNPAAGVEGGSFCSSCSQSTFQSAAGPSAGCLPRPQGEAGCIAAPPPENGGRQAKTARTELRAPRRRSSGIADLRDMAQLKEARFATNNSFPSTPLQQQSASAVANLQRRARADALLGSTALAAPLAPSAAETTSRPRQATGAVIRVPRRRSNGISDLLEMDLLKQAQIAAAATDAETAGEVPDNPLLPLQVPILASSNMDAGNVSQAPRNVAVNDRSSDSVPDLPAFVPVGPPNSPEPENTSNVTSNRLLELAAKARDRRTEEAEEAEGSGESSRHSCRSGHTQCQV